jgi:hypothetical protein
MVVAVDIVIPVGGGFAAIKAHVVNVSTSGLGIRAKEPVQENTQISVKMKAVWITGKIRYCVQIDTSLYDMGLQVSDVSEGGKSLDRFPAFWVYLRYTSTAWAVCTSRHASIRFYVQCAGAV